MKDKNLLNRAGQSTIEFLMTIVFTLSILFMFVFLGINVTSGYLVHYSTFMASRTYLVAEANSNQAERSDALAEREAKKVFDSYQIGRLGVRNPNQFPLSFNSPGRAKYVYVGVRYQFEQLLNTLKVFGPSIKGTMISESYLGKEPSRITCFERICRAMEEANGSTVSCGQSLGQYTLFDNGC